MTPLQLPVCGLLKQVHKPVPLMPSEHVPRELQGLHADPGHSEVQFEPK